MKLLKLAGLLSLLCISSAWAIEPFTVRDIRVEGIQRTEAGTVFLLGLVTRKEGDDAAEIARTTAGVKKVVRVFEYIEFKDAQRLDNRPPEETKAKPAEQK